MLLTTLLPLLLLPLTLAQQRLPPAKDVTVHSTRAHGSKPPAEFSAQSLSDGLDDDDISLGGTGCRSDSVGTAFNSNRTLLTLIFDDFVAEIGPNIPVQKSRRFCTVSLKMAVPTGWTFQVEKADWRGHYDLDRGVRGALVASYYFTAQQQEKTKIRKRVQGPLNSDYLKHQEGERDRAVWMPCTTAKESDLTIHTAVHLTVQGTGRGGAGGGGNGNAKGAPKGAGASTTAAKAAKGVITVDSLDAKFKQVLNLSWKQC
ncbi:hypothetical protein EJ06DRAFT_370918 [Trichodelitschia bisporula]|uniref:Secreted protein n=1 Tax=Trichodelitschia bisporula TaxID=703511 RepID=A0A6G1I1N9_9PEZI|nr:hypothetical protein EJ06DRAFT_370918 [Trichodelitschia bisporula]